MENNDTERPLGELVRRATHVALMSPLLVFLATPFDEQNRPYSPSIFTVRAEATSLYINCFISSNEL